eukprot:m.200492 g.200492  ORF g.200492 m.200492 type:complete len:161 (-) comp14959_c1_seq11:1554-2036(-)
MHTHNARSDDNSVGTLFLMLHCFDSIQALAKRVRELETQLERYRHLDAHPSSAVTSRTPVASAATDPAKPKASTQRSSGKRKQKSQKQFDYSQYVQTQLLATDSDIGFTLAHVCMYTHPGCMPHGYMFILLLAQAHAPKDCNQVCVPRRKVPWTGTTRPC